MKKTAFILLCASFLFASCKSTFTATNYENPAVQVDAQTAAEMTVSPTRISYTYEPTSLTAKTGFDNILQTAVEEALKANGNADLLVDLKYSYVVKHKLYSDVYLSITVTGFPAKYTTFRPMQLYGYTPDGTALYYEDPVAAEKAAAEKAAAEKAAAVERAAAEKAAAEKAAAEKAAAEKAAAEKAAAEKAAAEKPAAEDAISNVAPAERIDAEYAKAEKNKKYLANLGTKEASQLAKDYDVMINYVFANPTEYNLDLLTLANNNIFMHLNNLASVIKKYDGLTSGRDILYALSK